ncbi:hypothetical protein [Pseudomonas sp. TH31]|uniref:hypothetical protein n=1 Tax=Pseudomonas sp. TH31 TaxID=2796396 RepID=UPI00191454D4|nr:hypothetical protein [Pseudomonas sp. TH31]MBK5418393.1 hypothetical protein [Pseudomonas sp. TH31]
MATVKPVARIGIPSTFAFPDPEALHAKDSWPDSLRWSANVPGDLCAISSKGKASENKKTCGKKSCIYSDAGFALQTDLPM